MNKTEESTNVGHALHMGIPLDAGQVAIHCSICPEHFFFYTHPKPFESKEEQYQIVDNLHASHMKEKHGVTWP